MTDTAHLARPEPVRPPSPDYAPGPTPSSSSRWTGTSIDASAPASRPSSPTCPPVVVELGAGAGASMRYLAPGTRLVAIEPNPHTHDALRRNAARYGIDLEIREERAESTGLADRERRRGDLHARALHGGGPGRCARGSAPHPASGRTFRVHRARWVRSRCRSARCSALLRRPWRYVFDGCCLDRDTAAAIAATGFADVRIEHYRLGGVFVPVWPADQWRRSRMRTDQER